MRRLWWGALAVSLVLAAPARAADSPSVVMFGQRGDFISSGLRIYRGPGEVALRGGLYGFTISVHPRGDGFSFDFSPSGHPLKPGDYPRAQRAAFHQPGHPGLDIAGLGHGCGDLTGRFLVKQIRTAGNGDVKAAWILFEQHCEHASAPALFGEVRVGVPPPSGAARALPSALR